MRRYLTSWRYSVTIAVFTVLSISQLGWSQAPPRESMQDLMNRLTPPQKQLFDQATKAFNAQQYLEALALFKQLLTALPADPVLLKFTSEAALNTGDTAFAMTNLQPLATADPNDWQAAALLTRACAESGNTTCRDTGMAHMLDLHNRGIVPRGLQAYIIEHVKAGENTLTIRHSLVPWGYYKVYDLGQVADKDGKIFLRITLESNDADQALFAQNHPEEAAKGLRSFSLDGYRETGWNANGQRTQTHYTYKFFVGQPSYDTVRQEFLKIANGKGMPLSSRTNLTVP